MTTYIIKKQEFSEKALRRMGNGNVWKPVAKTKVRLQLVSESSMNGFGFLCNGLVKEPIT